MLCSATGATRSRPTQARIRIQRDRGAPALSEHHVHEVRCHAGQPDHRGDRDGADHPVYRIQTERIFSTSSWIRANAGKNTSVIGAAMRLNGDSITL